jgi:hypothetical protein
MCAADGPPLYVDQQLHRSQKLQALSAAKSVWLDSMLVYDHKHLACNDIRESSTLGLELWLFVLCKDVGPVGGEDDACLDRLQLLHHVDRAHLLGV